MTLQVLILILEEQHGKPTECISMTYAFFVLSRLEMKVKEQKINSTLVINNYIHTVLSSSIMVRVLAILKYSLVLCRSTNDTE